jgi:7-cyano-7-deazaguanine synthase in queuosine biosynthesis
VNLKLHSDKKIGLMFSGGTDSSIVLFLLLNSNPEITIVLHTIDLQTRPAVKMRTKKIVKLMQDMFPLAKIVHSLSIIPDEQIYMNISRDDFRVAKRAHTKYVIEKFTEKYRMFNGMTAHYPKEIMIEHDLWDTRMLDRYPDVDKLKSHMAPLGLKDKFVVRDLYIEYDLLDTLFPLTISCAHPMDMTGTPCGWCAGCREKYVAFKCY